MEEGLGKKRRFPQEKEISKERRVCDIIVTKEEGLKKKKSILEQDFDSAQTRKRAAHN